MGAVRSVCTWTRERASVWSPGGDGRGVAAPCLSGAPPGGILPSCAHSKAFPDNSLGQRDFQDWQHRSSSHGAGHRPRFCGVLAPRGLSWWLSTAGDVSCRPGVRLLPSWLARAATAFLAVTGSGESKDQISPSKMLFVGSDVFVVSGKYTSGFCSRDRGTIIWNAFCRVGNLM